MTTARIQVHVEPDHLALTLGERATIEVDVFNGTPIVDEFRVDLVGPWEDPIRPEWVTAQPRSLSLFPNTSGTVVLTLDVPAASQLLAGRHVVGIRIRSLTDGSSAHVAELPITIHSQPVVSVHLEPQATAGGSAASSSVVARNLGNVAVNLWLTTADPANAVRFTLDRTEVLLPPDEEARVPLRLQARRPLLGTGVVRSYSVVADVEDRAADVGAESTPYVEPVRAEGTFQQRPRINGRILTTIGFLLPVAAILVAAFILRPQAEPVVLSGPLSFGVAGVVERVDVRPGDFVLAGHRIAWMNGGEAQIEFDAAFLALRRAIVDLEGIKTERLVAEAGGALDGPAGPAEPEFLQALVEQLQASIESARTVASTSLQGLSDALGSYCASLDAPLPPECVSQPIPLPSTFTTQLAGDPGNPLARAVLDANANYRSAAATLQSVTRMAQEAEAALAMAGSPQDTPAPAPSSEELAVLSAQSAQEQAEYELKLLEQQAAIAEAQLACRQALQNVGRTVLRAPVDIVIIDVLVTAGAEVDADSPIVIVERTDGRVFTPPAGQRAPAPEDLPDGASCPSTIVEFATADAARK